MISTSLRLLRFPAPRNSLLDFTVYGRVSSHKSFDESK